MLFLTFRLLTKREKGREKIRATKKPKKVGEMDDETCMKGL